MAKKSAKKAPKKKATAVHAKPKGKAKAAKKASKPKAASPRSQVLPGMEQIRNARLDNICESLADVRGQKNELIVEEGMDLDRALKIMENSNVPVYLHAGVEMALISDGVHLRVRLVKEKTNSNKKKKEADETKEESGSGQDAGEIAEALTPDEAAEDVSE